MSFRFRPQKHPFFVVRYTKHPIFGSLVGDLRLCERLRVWRIRCTSPGVSTWSSTDCSAASLPSMSLTVTQSKLRLSATRFRQRSSKPQVAPRRQMPGRSAVSFFLRASRFLFYLCRMQMLQSFTFERSHTGSGKKLLARNGERTAGARDAGTA